jgi:hypothetical protein
MSPRLCHAQCAGMAQEGRICTTRQTDNIFFPVTYLLLFFIVPYW